MTDTRFLRNVRLDVALKREGDTLVVHVHLNEHRASRGTFGHIHATAFDAKGDPSWKAEQTPKLVRHGGGRPYGYAELTFLVPAVLVEGGKILLKYDLPGS